MSHTVQSSIESATRNRLPTYCMVQIMVYLDQPFQFLKPKPIQSAFMITSGSSSTESTASTAHMAPSLSLVTWNVLKDETKIPSTIDRYQSTFAHLVKCDADVVCLQEVTGPFVRLLSAHAQLVDRYNISCLDSNHVVYRPYGQAILVRKQLGPVRFLSYPMGKRGWNGSDKKIVSALVLKHNLLIVCLHLAARRSQYAMRLSQLGVVDSFIRHVQRESKSELHKIVCGDFNMGTPLENPEIAAIPADWHESECTDPTLDETTNPLVQPGTLVSRVDHVYAVGLPCQSLEVMPIQQCSDHYPLLATFKQS